MSKVRRNISQGALRATADAIEQMFGADEGLDLDFDNFDDFDADLDEDLDEIYGADADLDIDLLLADDDEDDDGDNEGFGVADSFDDLVGRREMANSARAQFRGNGGASDGFRAGVMYGYMQSLQDAGVSAEYGLFKKLFAGPKKLVGAATKGLLGSQTATAAAQQLGQGVASGLVAQHSPPTLSPSPVLASVVAATTPAPVSATIIAHQLGQRVGSGLGIVGGPAPSGTAPVQAVKQTLPPVFVADKAGFEADANLLEGRALTLRGAHANLPVEERFGATGLKGFVGGQARKSARFAARDAAKNGATVLALSERVSSAAPFVEDLGAEPVLFGDGRIFDSVYGELVAMPCPSCAPLSERDVFAGLGRKCAVCDGYGAFLTPVSDVSQWSGGVQYGLIPLLIPLITAGASAAAPALSEGGKGWLASKKQEKMADLASREQVILARLKKKEEKVASVVASPASVPKPELNTKPELDEDEKDILEDEDFGSLVGISLDDMLESEFTDESEEDDDDEVFGISESELSSFLDDDDDDDDDDEAFGISESEISSLLDDDDDDDEFGAEDASSGTLAQRTTCVRALVPSSYLRDMLPRRGAQ